jgi:CheY-like chemotaxis protein
VYTAAPGAKGLKILIHGPEYLRVVVLDYRMPNFDGADTMRFLHQVRRGVKVIALTTAEDTELPEDFVRGADRIIHKPFHPDHLIAAVRECSTPRN